MIGRAPVALPLDHSPSRWRGAAFIAPVGDLALGAISTWSGETPRKTREIEGKRGEERPSQMRRTTRFRGSPPRSNELLCEKTWRTMRTL